MVQPASQVPVRWDGIPDGPRLRTVDLDAVQMDIAAGRLPVRHATKVGGVDTTLGEHPAWSAELAAVIWVDIRGGAVFATAPDGATRVLYREQGPVGAALPRPDGTLCIAGSARVLMLDPATGAMAELPGPRDGFRFNDASLAPDGWLWAGDLPCDPDLEDLPLCRVARHATDRADSVELLTGMGCPNGIVWNGNATRVWVCETVTRTIAEASFDASSGLPGDWSMAFRFVGTCDVVPDGLYWTPEGLWVACWGLGAVLLVGWDGAVVEAICVDDERATSVVIAPDGVAWVTSAVGLWRADQLGVTVAD